MSVYDQHKPQGSNDLYLKLKDGDKVKLRFASEPVITVYREDDKPRYAWIVWNRELAKPQIYGAGVSIYSQVSNLIEDWGDPTDFDITIKRTGSGMQDTEYSVVPVKLSDDLTKDQLAEVDKIDLPKATKGKWLKDYIEDGELPAPITDLPSRQSEPTHTDEDMPPDVGDKDDVQ